MPWPFYPSSNQHRKGILWDYFLSQDPNGRYWMADVSISSKSTSIGFDTASNSFPFYNIQHNIAARGTHVTLHTPKGCAGMGVGRIAPSAMGFKDVTPIQNPDKSFVESTYS
jgi:hypothetical protein